MHWILSLIAVFAESYFLLIWLIDLEVVVHEGRIREKPSSKDEARNFIEGLLDTTSSHIAF